jgi:hypothetical protein
VLQEKEVAPWWCGVWTAKSTACSFGLLDISQQYFSLRTNQTPAISQQYFSLRTNQHQPSATSQTNRLPQLKVATRQQWR